MGSVNQAFGGPFKHLLKTDEQAEIKISDKEILKESQISYRAEGGFTGVQSYGVILSCVNGKVSVMKSIYDPRLSSEKSRTREIGSMELEKYVRLWNNMDQQALFKMQDSPLPKMDIADEFTLHFYAKAGKNLHQFQVVGISRTEAARYFAIRKLIDDAVQMQALWNVHNDLAKNIKDAHLDDSSVVAANEN